MTIINQSVQYMVIKHDDEYHITNTSKDLGHAMVSSENLDEALNKFKTAMNVSVALINLYNFKNLKGVWRKISGFKEKRDC